MSGIHSMPFAIPSNLTSPSPLSLNKIEFLRFVKKQLGLAEKDYEPGRIILVTMRMIQGGTYQLIFHFSSVCCQ
jgi:hypothetical protein